MDLRDIDLNLLVMLDALLSEQSVSRAARRLKRSQPAVSAALARLPEVLRDALLVLRGPMMAPTPYAKSLEAPLRNVLREIERSASSPVPLRKGARPKPRGIAGKDRGGSGSFEEIGAERTSWRREWDRRARGALEPPCDPRDHGRLSD
jgi:hypothetical protein